MKKEELRICVREGENGNERKQSLRVPPRRTTILRYNNGARVVKCYDAGRAGRDPVGPRNAFYTPVCTGLGTGEREKKKKGDIVSLKRDYISLYIYTHT